MSRQRKSLSPALRFVPAVKAAVLCAFIGGSAIGYVWQKNQILELGRRIKEKENRLAQLRQANQKLSRQLVTLRSPPYLDRRVRELNLNLGQPTQVQILRLVETTAGEAPAAKDLLLAGRNGGPAPSVRGRRRPPLVVRSTAVLVYVAQRRAPPARFASHHCFCRSVPGDRAGPGRNPARAGVAPRRFARDYPDL